MNDLTQSTAPDYDALLQANLTRVFSERDPERRIEAIRELYEETAVLYEPNDFSQGHDRISQAVGVLLDGLPPDFEFRSLGPAVGHHGVGRLRWSGGPKNGVVIVTGTDVAHFVNGQIHTLHVLLDPPTQS
ncbi:nuclear transport factor 2 family protein [bacterium]|nr:MAG: nuclear transport factor 2 family protein [bacterium]